MERREDIHRHGCSIAKQTILTTHPSGLQTRVSVELANFDALCVHSECSTKTKRPMWEGSPFLSRRGILGGVSAHGTPVLGRRSDVVNEGRLSQQCTPVMRRREVESPGGSPLPARRCDEELESDVDNSVISGWLKFRDNKRMDDTLNFLVIKLTGSSMPHRWFPQNICVPRSWMTTCETVQGPRKGVLLPKKKNSEIQNMVRYGQSPDETFEIYWAEINSGAVTYGRALELAKLENRELKRKQKPIQRRPISKKKTPNKQPIRNNNDRQQETTVNPKKRKLPLEKGIAKKIKINAKSSKNLKKKTKPQPKLQQQQQPSTSSTSYVNTSMTQIKAEKEYNRIQKERIAKYIKNLHEKCVSLETEYKEMQDSFLSVIPHYYTMYDAFVKIKDDINEELENIDEQLKEFA